MNRRRKQRSSCVFSLPLIAFELTTVLQYSRRIINQFRWLIKGGKRANRKSNETQTSMMLILAYLTLL